MDRIDVGKFVHVKLQPGATEPYPRSGHCCATDGTNLFVYGGYHPAYCRRGIEQDNEDLVTENKVFTEMWCFNLFTETWRKVSPKGDVPTTGASPSMIFDTGGRMLLLYGGTNYPWGDYSNADVIAFMLQDKMWKSLECTGASPAGKYGTAMIVKQEYLYFFGGCRRLPNEEYLFNSELHCLNLRSKSWSLLSDDPEDYSKTMYRHSLACHDNKLYVIGSSYTDLATKKNLDKVHVFDLGTRTWYTKGTLPCLSGAHSPKQRKYQSCVQWENEVYISGGHNNRVVFDDIWKLELPSLQWSKIPTKMPTTAYFHSAAITSTKCMYTFGGITDLEDRSRINSVFRIWLDIPPLRDMALRKVLSLLPDRSPGGIAKLKDFGVPINVMEMLEYVE